MNVTDRQTKEWHHQLQYKPNRLSVMLANNFFIKITHIS